MAFNNIMIMDTNEQFTKKKKKSNQNYPVKVYCIIEIKFTLWVNKFTSSTREFSLMGTIIIT